MVDRIEYMKNIPSEDLYKQIIKQGLPYIDEAINTKTVENYYLDFKLTEKDDYTEKRKLFMPDRKNYAKCISAFGNSDGGVIIWGIKTGTSDADYATKKQPIKNVSNFRSLLEGFTSILTIPVHTNVINSIIFEDETNDIGYVITHIPKSNRRPFQVINEGDFRYYIRAGSNSLPAPDTLLRSLFGQEPQPNAFIHFGVAPIVVGPDDTIEMTIGIIVHNNGENVAKNINGYVQIGGSDLAIEVNTNTLNQFSYNTNSIVGMKVGFVAKADFILGIEQDVQPLIMHLTLNKPVSENGIQIITLLSCDNQRSYRLSKFIEKEELENIYDNYIADRNYDIMTAILGQIKDDK